MSASTGPRCSLASKRRLSCLRVLGVSLLIAATPGTGLAKERLPRVYLGLGAGANLVLSDWDLDETDTAGRPQSAESSPLFELRLGLDLLDWLSFEAGAGYLPLSAGEDEVDAVHLHASARFPFARDTIEPYLMVGVGAYMNPDGDRGADQDPAVHYGGGVAIGLADWLDLSTGINPSGWPVPTIPAT
ncbi:MAG TPA: outer membrane beta-barrel protein, partial [Myxococcota bacterium]|nr:outer membrane beta-barrel protein [Myxococcota bacterium]